MTNEELIGCFADGNKDALEELCTQNTALIKSRALKIAQAYNCIQDSGQGKHTNYTKETLSDLESVGMLAFIECVKIGSYDNAKGLLSTYAVPFIDSAMRRHLEVCLGSLSLDRNSMALVRQAQMLFDREGKTVEEIANILGVSIEDAEKHITYQTHFLSVYALANPEDDNDVFDYITGDADISGNDPAEIVYRRIRIEYLWELFDTLSKQEQDILGKCFGVFGYSKTPLREIAMFHMIKEDAVEKVKGRALKKLREAYPGSMVWWWSKIRKLFKNMGH